VKCRTAVEVRNFGAVAYKCGNAVMMSIGRHALQFGGRAWSAIVQFPWPGILWLWHFADSVRDIRGAGGPFSVQPSARDGM